MTISIVYIVYGVRLSYKKFIEFILQNKHHSWYALLEETIETNGLSIDKFADYITKVLGFNYVDNEDEYSDYEDLAYEIMDNLKWKSSTGDLQVYEITHDTLTKENSDDIVIGFPISEICIDGGRKSTSTPVSWKLDDYQKHKIENNAVIQLLRLDCAFFNIQNDCRCCS